LFSLLYSVIAPRCRPHLECFPIGLLQKPKQGRRSTGNLLQVPFYFGRACGPRFFTQPEFYSYGLVLIEDSACACSAVVFLPFFERQIVNSLFEPAQSFLFFHLEVPSATDAT